MKRFLAVSLSILAVVFGLGLILFTISFGHCSAFGGRCPRDTWFDFEIFSTALTGAAVAIGVPTAVFSGGTRNRRITRTVVSGGVAGLLVGGLVTSITYA